MGYNRVHTIQTEQGPVLITRLDFDTCEAMGVQSESLLLTRIKRNKATGEEKALTVLITVSHNNRQCFSLISKGLRLGPTTSTEAVVGFIYATDPLRARCEGM